MNPPETRYVDRDGAALAYQVIGHGPADVVAYLEITQHLDMMWTDPDIHRNFERAAGFSRVACFQRRGFGLSDSISYVPTIEQQADDVLAVMDAVGMQRATLGGVFATCAPLALVAARAPERVSGMVFYMPLAQGVQLPGDVVGWSAGAREAYLAYIGRVFANWGSGESLPVWDPVQATAFNTRLMAMLERSSATPAAAQAYFQWVGNLEISDVLRSVQVPTRVLYFPTGTRPEASVRYVAELLPRGTFHLLPATKPGASIGRTWEPFIDHVEEEVTGAPHDADADRFLGTVLFTDIVSSTELLAVLGDAEYRERRSDHEREIRVAVEDAGGRLVKVIGDGTLSVFDGPTKAVRCAQRISREAEAAGIAVRCGVHTGEIERDGMDVTGITIHLCARVQSAANPGEVLVSRTVHDLTVGSGLTFASRGEHELRGIPGRWELFVVTHAGEQQGTVVLDESLAKPLDRMALSGARRMPGLARAGMRIANAIERRRAR